METTTLSFPGRGSVLTEYSNPPLDLQGGRYVMALVDLHTFYSIPNVVLKNDTFFYQTVPKGPWETVRIPEGSYSIEALEAALKKALKPTGVTLTLTGDNATMKCTFKCSANVSFNDLSPGK